MSTWVRSARVRLWPLTRVDWAVGAALMLVIEAEVVLRFWHLPRAAPVTGLAGVLLLGLAWWRRFPLLAMASLSIHSLIGLAVGAGQTTAPVFAVFLISYALGAYAGWRQLLAGALIPPATTAIIDTLHPGPYPVLSSVLYFASFEVAAPVLVGRLVRSRAHLVDRLRERTAELQVERELAAAMARAAELEELSRRLDALVVSGVQDIVAQATATRASGDGQAAAIRIESRARALLEGMRGILQDLGSAPPVATALPDVARRRTEPGRPKWPWHQLTTPVLKLPWELIFAAAFFLALELELAVRSELTAHGAQSILGGLALAAPFAWSRSRPVAAAAVSLAAATLFSRLVVPLESLLMSVALFLALPFSVAVTSTLRWAVVGLVVCAVGLSAAFGVSDVVTNGGLVSIGFWLVGLYVHDRSRLAVALHAANRDLAEERDARARRAVLQERSHVARELHDVVGHALTVVVLQAGAARRLWKSDPERAREALSTVAEIARGGLSGVLGSLRALDAEDAVQPALADVRAVVEMARAAGLRVDLEMSASPPVVAGELARALHRIVQEALTNALKHAPGSETTVSICRSDGTIQLEVVNSLPAIRPPARPEGQGLRNIAARVAELGGSLDWGPDDGRFRVRVQLPVSA